MTTPEDRAAALSPPGLSALPARAVPRGAAGGPPLARSQVVHARGGHQASRPGRSRSGAGTGVQPPASAPLADAGEDPRPGRALPLLGARPGQGQDARTWTLEMPAGMRLLSQNGRLHHYERYRRGKALKEAAFWLARQAGIPRLGCAVIVVEYQPPNRRDTDNDNVPPASGKPCIDGLVAAGILPDDSRRYVTSVTGMIGPVYPKGRLVLHLTEVPGGGAP